MLHPSPARLAPQAHNGRDCRPPVRALERELARRELPEQFPATVVVQRVPKLDRPAAGLVVQHVGHSRRAHVAEAAKVAAKVVLHEARR